MEVSIQAAGDSSSTTIEIVPPPRVDITIDRGVTGPQGPAGPQGAPGVGIPVGGSTGQVLAKTSSADYATGWTTGGTVTSVDVSGDLTGLTFTGGPITSSGTITLGGTLAVASGGTGVATSSGANSVMLRDANANTSINALFSGYSNVAATGTVTTLTVASPYSWIVTGSGGQTYQLPNATTLPVGAIYTFNNNQSSGTIVVRNNSATTVITVQSGSVATLTLLSNANAAGSWDSHYSTPSNASWSTNTLNWAGSYTNGTWNGNAVDILRGGTGASTASAAFNALSPITSTGDLIVGNGTNSAARLGVGTTGQVLTSTGTTATWSAANAGTVTSVATAGTVNGITLTGGPITSSGTVTLGGTLDLSSPPAIGGTTPAAGSFTTLIGGAGSANYVQTVGAATTLDPVTSAQGSDADVSLVFQSKGTGAIDLAAGSTGVNISNGNTVTAIVRAAAGSGYTTPPTWAASVSNTSGGTTASGSVTNIGVVTATVSAGGSGYAVGNVLTISGGTSTTAATVTVATVSSGAVLTVTISNAGAYTAVPTNPAATTGGAGSGATFTLSFGINAAFTITQAGTGYVEQPTITFSGGGGTGAAAGAVIGSGTKLQSLGSSLSIYTPGGETVRISDNNQSGFTSYLSFKVISSVPAIFAEGSGSSIALTLSSKNTGNVNINTNAGAQQQFQVSHTASAVNYIQTTGSVTSPGASTLGGLLMTGSDASTTLAIGVKGTAGYIAFYANASTNTQAFKILVSGAVTTGNMLQVQPAAAGSAPTISAINNTSGTDSAVSMNILTKGTGSINLQTGGGTQAVVSSTASAVNYLNLTGAATGAYPVLSALGTDPNINIIFTPKGSGTVQFGTYTAGIIAQAGYITITDSGGTTRRLLVG